MSLLRLCFLKTEGERPARSAPLSKRRFFQPSLGKFGLFGMILCLAAGLFVPPAGAATSHQAPQAWQPAGLNAQL